jgi:hypothetical protein
MTLFKITRLAEDRMAKAAFGISVARQHCSTVGK